MIKRFRSKIGLYLGLSYLVMCLLTVLALFISTPDSMSFLALLFLTSPWSFLLLDAAPENIAAGGGLAAFVLILTVSALLNALIFYLLGFLISKVIPFLKD